MGLLLLAAALLPPVSLGAQVRGSLFIVGGGGQPDSLVTRFVMLAGGPGRARILVLPMAGGPEPEAGGAEKAEQLRAFGADADVLEAGPANGDDPALVRQVEAATGIWFTGGDQVLLVDALRGTAVLRALRARYRAGAVIGGTSAGAAVMGDSMLTGNQRRPDSLGYYGDEFPEVARGVMEVRPGLGLLPGVLVDQHFVRRERANRLLAAVLERPAMLGVGIDEGTAVEVAPDGHWSVTGRGLVIVLDARRGQVLPAGPLGGTEVRLQVLPPGSRYDPRTGRATLPAAVGPRSR